MTYLKNDEEQKVLTDQCSSCRLAFNDKVNCPVFGAQMTFNFIQMDSHNHDLRKALDMMIKDGQCQVKLAIDEAVQHPDMRLEYIGVCALLGRLAVHIHDEEDRESIERAMMDCEKLFEEIKVVKAGDGWALNIGKAQ